ncbi:preprotein translocase subunit SecG [Chloroflexota bacterium]
MEKGIQIAQIILSVLLLLILLLQLRGGGLGSIFGSDQSEYRTRRGVEKSMFQLTIVLAAVFFGLSIASMIAG